MPKSQTRKPWNKGRAQGQKAPFSRRSIGLISGMLKEGDKWRDLALFRVGLDTMLRASDLLKLTLGDVTDERRVIRESWTVQQKKTGEPVTLTLTAPAIEALSHWLEVDQGNKWSRDDFLFTRLQGDTSQPITRQQYGSLVKVWAGMVGLDKALFGTHSLRRSKASLMYAAGVDLETLRILLGQATLDATKHYLGISRQEASLVASKFVL